MVKKIIFWFLLFLIWIILYFNFSLFSWNNEWTNLVIQIHNWKTFDQILNKENYKKVWINPEKYSDFHSFLDEFSTYSWVLIDPINEKFVIWVDDNDWILYTAFDFKNNWDVFNDKDYKNLAILDIYDAYKKWKLYWWVNSRYGKRILFETDFEHPTSNILWDIFDWKKNVYKTIDLLWRSTDLSVVNKELLWYLDDFVWNYEEWIKQRDELCKSNKDLCEKFIEINVSWKVKDQNGNLAEWIKISLLNNWLTTETNNKWEYNLKFKFYNFSHLRFKAYWNWYSDGFNTISINNSYIKNKNIVLNFTVSEAKWVYKINKNTVSKYKKWIYYIIEDWYSKYFIPRSGLYFENWDKYNWLDFTVYTYLFTKHTSSESMLANDTFQPVYWFVWNIMKTFWMPYIQFIDNITWKELFIRASNPMILQNHIYHMKELYNNYDKIYEAISDEDMEYLVEYSEKKWGFPITFDFLTENNFLRWPAWWVLDRKKWIWECVGSRVIDTNWLVELPFYSINDK